MDAKPAETPDQQPGETTYPNGSLRSRIHIKVDLAAGEKINIRVKSSRVDGGSGSAATIETLDQFVWQSASPLQRPAGLSFAFPVG